MLLSLQKYKYILTVALDHQLILLKGGIVFDDYDPAVEGDKILRTRLERFVKQKKVDKLEKMLQDFIQRFRIKDDHNFASVLFKETGYKIEAIPVQQFSVSTSRNLRVGMSGKDDNRLTFVSIELPTGSGAIYCIKGFHPDLKADWLDSGTVEVQIPTVREEVERVKKVKVYDETINILYKELKR